ncbi:MAG: ROK family protein, partial [Clostridia bacterium]|nr:ROK family protein [Clostridia bacterium]
AGGIISIVSFLDPELIVLGGGVSRAGDFLLQPVRKKVAEGKFFKALPTGEIVIATLGNDAGIIGAAMLHRA